MRWIVLIVGMLGAAWIGICGKLWNDTISGSSDLKFLTAFSHLRTDGVGEEVRSGLGYMEHAGTAMFLLAALSLLGAALVFKRGRIGAPLLLIAPAVSALYAAQISFLPMDAAMTGSLLLCGPSGLAGVLALAVGAQGDARGRRPGPSGEGAL